MPARLVVPLFGTLHAFISPGQPWMEHLSGFLPVALYHVEWPANIGDRWCSLMHHYVLCYHSEPSKLFWIHVFTAEILNCMPSACHTFLIMLLLKHNYPPPLSHRVDNSMPLKDGLLELIQLCDLLATGRVEEMLDEKKRQKNYPAINLKNLQVVLSKFRQVISIVSCSMLCL